MALMRDRRRAGLGDRDRAAGPARDGTPPVPWLRSNERLRIDGIRPMLLVNTNATWPLIMPRPSAADSGRHREPLEGSLGARVDGCVAITVALSGNATIGSTGAALRDTTSADSRPKGCHGTS